MFAANYSDNVDEGTLAVALMQPASRGRLRLRSTDCGAQPWIEFRMLREEADCAAMGYGIELALRLARHRALSRICTNASAPGLTDDVLDEDRALSAWLRANCVPFFHAVGTCRMGAKDDPDSVVDP